MINGPAPTIATSFETFLLDLDGVVYVADEALPGAVETLQRLRRQGKALRFLTNDPRPTRRDIVRRLSELNIECHIPEVVTSGWATAIHLKESRLRSSYVVGSDGLRREIESVGVRLRGKEEVDAVVVGCDEDVAYPQICRAARLIRGSAQFIATNNDATFPTADGPAPATGTIVAAIATASDHVPRIIGKPGPYMYRTALGGLDPEGAVMVGDSLSTDIAGAVRLGLAALWVTDRPSDAGDEGKRSASVRPDGEIRVLSDMFDPELTLS